MTTLVHGIEFWVDTRERAVFSSFNAATNGVKLRYTYDIKISQMSTSDYAVIYRGRILVLIERKTWIDLHSTVLDPTRKFNYKKMLELQKAHGCNVFYIMEGKRPAHVHKMESATLMAHLDHLYFDHGIVTIYSENTTDTIVRILRLVNNLITSNDPRIAQIDAQILQQYMTPQTPQAEVKTIDGGADVMRRVATDDSAVTNSMWKKIRGVSDMAYPTLRKNLKLCGLILKQYTVQQLADAKLTKTNGHIMTEKTYTKILRSGASPKAHVRILTEIPLVSADSAKLILDKYSLEDIILHIYSARPNSAVDIANITRSTGTRLGKALEENVFRYLLLCDK